MVSHPDSSQEKNPGRKDSIDSASQDINLSHYSQTEQDTHHDDPARTLGSLLSVFRALLLSRLRELQGERNQTGGSNERSGNSSPVDYDTSGYLSKHPTELIESSYQLQPKRDKKQTKDINTYFNNKNDSMSHGVNKNTQGKVFNNLTQEVLDQQVLSDQHCDSLDYYYFRKKLKDFTQFLHTSLDSWNKETLFDALGAGLFHELVDSLEQFDRELAGEQLAAQHDGMGNSKPSINSPFVLTKNQLSDRFNEVINGCIDRLKSYIYTDERAIDYL